MKNMMKKLVSAGLLIGSMAMMQSCATGLSKSEYGVKVQSDPSGQDFSIVNRAGEVVHKGKTPEVVYLKSQSDFFAGEQYKYMIGNKSDVFKARTSYWYFGNIVGLVGFVVDPLTGSAYDLPDRVTFKNGKVSSDFGVLTGGEVLD